MSGGRENEARGNWKPIRCASWICLGWRRRADISRCRVLVLAPAYADRQRIALANVHVGQTQSIDIDTLLLKRERGARHAELPDSRRQGGNDGEKLSAVSYQLSAISLRG